MLSILLSFSCHQNSNQAGYADSQLPGKTTDAYHIRYAKRFTVEPINGYPVIRVNSPYPGSDAVFTYILKDSLNTSPLPDIPGAQVINIPIRSIVCYSTSHLPALEMLGEAGTLIGFPNTSYISSPDLRQRVSDGQITDLGSSADVGYESIVNLGPGLVMAYTMGSDMNTFSKIQSAGIPVVFNADYMENTPLGRAEWIKFTGLFFGKEKMADSIFSVISNHYVSIKSKVKDAAPKPTVLTGVVYGDSWFLPGGRNYAAVFFKDAGSRYYWADDSSTSTLQLSFESVYEKAAGADFWVGTATYNSLNALKNADARYAQFDAFKQDHIYNYSARMRPGGGNDYFETGYARPDLILGDLAFIFHPDLMKGHKMYFYQKIE